MTAHSSTLLPLLLAAGSLFAAEADLSDFRQQVDLASASSAHVVIEVGAADLTVHSADIAALADLNIRHHPNRVPSVSYLVEGNRGELLVSNTEDGQGSSWNLNMNTDNDSDIWNLTLSRRVPLDLQVNFGMGSGSVDLGDMTLNTLEFTTGLSDVQLDFSQPCKGTLEEADLATGLGKMEVRGLGNAPFSDLEFSGGLGSAILDFSGNRRQDMDVHLDVGMGSLTLLIPRDFGIKVKHEDNFFSKSEFGDLERVGSDTWYSENWQEAPGNLNLVLSVGMGSVRLERVEE